MTKLRKRKSVLPQASMTGKIDELLIRFMSDPDTMRRLKEKYDEIRRDELTMDMVMNQTLELSQHKHENGEQPQISPRPPSSPACSPRDENGVRRSSSLTDRSLKQNQVAQSPRGSIVKVAKGTTRQEPIARFYFPYGHKNRDPMELESQIEALYRIFPSTGGGTIEHIEEFCAHVKVPKTWRKLVCHAASKVDNLALMSANGTLRESILPASVEKLWRKCHFIADTESLFIWLITAGAKTVHADDEGLFLFVLDLIFTVDSLKFLRDAPDFWRLYGITVIQRLSYVCRSWNGLIARHQLKHSDFLTVVEDLAAGGDVNDDHKFFSYEHFYVIYCKFFELDVTKRNALSLAELSRYAEDSGINERVFARVYLLRRYQDTASFDYRDFVWFILSEEDKTQPMSIEFWFHVLDQDGDGLISMFDLESFYAETCKLLTRENIEAVTFNDKLTEILDRLGAAIKTDPIELRLGITLGQLRKSREVAQPILDTFINMVKYYTSDAEQSDPKPDEVESPWEQFAQEAYKALLEEGDDESSVFDNTTVYHDDLML